LHHNLCLISMISIISDWVDCGIPPRLNSKLTPMLSRLPSNRSNSSDARGYLISEFPWHVTIRYMRRWSVWLLSSSYSKERERETNLYAGVIIVGDVTTVVRCVDLQ